MTKLSAGEEDLGIVFHSRLVAIKQIVPPALYFSRTGITLTAVRDWPHSKQHAFKRDVINPQDGHILCDPNPAICGLSLRIL
jgi:hypothetical protein